VFAGTVDDPFFIDLGAAFDTGNFRAGASGIPGVMTVGAPGSGDDGANANFAPDTVSGFAVNAIALQVPITWLTSTGKVEASTSPPRPSASGAPLHVRGSPSAGRRCRT